VGIFDTRVLVFEVFDVEVVPSVDGLMAYIAIFELTKMQRTQRRDLSCYSN